jgi:hypothetical protein
MNARKRRRPSGAMVVAMIALVLAATGTAAAAGHLVSGNSLIKNGSLSGNRLRKHTITRKQINFKKLGKVPAAAQADHATSASFASYAANATNANTVGGQSAIAFEPSSDFIRTGLVRAQPGQIVPLASFGPFALTLNCVASGAAVRPEIDATSTVANSDGYGTPMPDIGTAYDILRTTTSSSTGFYESNDDAANFFTPDGATYVADLTVGENYLGARCYANALVSPS